jgi:hypothetical protein
MSIDWDEPPKTTELHIVLKCACEIEWQSDWSIDYYAEVHDLEDRLLPCPLRPFFYLDHQCLDHQCDEWVIGWEAKTTTLNSKLTDALTVIASWREGAAL